MHVLHYTFLFLELLCLCFLGHPMCHLHLYHVHRSFSCQAPPGITVNSHTHTHHNIIPFALHSIFGSVGGASQQSVMTLTVVMLPTAAPASTQLGDEKHVVASMCVYPHQRQAFSAYQRCTHFAHTHMYTCTSHTPASTGPSSLAQWVSCTCTVAHLNSILPLPTLGAVH